MHDCRQWMAEASFPGSAKALFSWQRDDAERGQDGEPELAFELLRRVWRQGYATEASLAVLDWARSSG